MKLWDHQAKCLSDVEQQRRAGDKRILVQGPTGSGKTEVMIRLILREHAQGKRVTLYTDRRQILAQTAGILDKRHIPYGIVAAGHKRDWEPPLQLCMVQSMRKRSVPYADLVLVDEAHNNKAAMIGQILQDHEESGSTVIGFSATPLEVGHIYDVMIQMGSVRELQSCGVLVKAHTFSPDEPDTHLISVGSNGEFTRQQITKVMPGHAIIGRVVEHYWRFNPAQHATLLFAPGAAEAHWFAEHLEEHGLRAASVTGDRTYCNGTWHDAGPRTRQWVFDLLARGQIDIVTNRFVLREGVDLPFVRHGILATLFGSPVSYVQACGRLLRSHPGKTHCTIQDHGGNYIRHGSINDDREWDMGTTAYMNARVRVEGMRQDEIPEPIICSKCHRGRLSGSVCPGCGYVSSERTRMVYQTNGRLVAAHGRKYKPRRRATGHGLEADWVSTVYRMKRAGKTFSQAEALFAKEHRWYWPSRGWRLMPVQDLDWFRRIQDVPESRLSSY